MNRHILILLLPLLAHPAWGADQASAAEQAQEEAQQFPILSQETVLVGITMPAGTKLQLPSPWSYGKEMVKAEYFEQAEFPQAVIWNGVPLQSMHRRLYYQDCFLADKKPCQKQMEWGWHLDSVLAEPTQINGFLCQGEVNWKRPETLDPNTDGHIPPVSADKPAPAYLADGCIAGKTHEFHSENQYLTFRLPENSRIFRTRFVVPEGPEGYTDFWTGNDFGGDIRNNTLSFNLFDLDMADWRLDLNSRVLTNVSGHVVKSTPKCPLAPDTYVQWSGKEPDILRIHSQTPVLQCGQFKMRLLKQPPQKMEWIEMQAE